MRHFLAHNLARFAAWLGRRSMPRGLSPGAGVFGGTIDAHRRRRAPSPGELLAELKNTAWACASVNAAVCASHPPRLYVATHDGQPPPRCARKALPPAAVEQLRAGGTVPGRFARACTIEEVTEHPLLTLLSRVNPVHNRHDLWELTTLYQEVQGCAYWQLHFNALGVPDEIWVLPAQHVAPRREPDSPRVVDYYEYHGGAERQTFAPGEIIHFRYPDLRDPYGGGLGPLRACFEQAALLSEYTAFKHAVLDNQAVPGAVISPREVISPDERERLELAWNQRFRRGGVGRVLVAEAGLQVDLLQPAVGDLATLAEYAATKEDIANAFGVPLAFLTGETNLANLRASHHQHLTLTIRPRLRRRDEKLNEQLVPLFDPAGRLFLAADDPTPVPPEQLRRREESDLRLGVRTINEIRAGRGLAPVPWGDAPWPPERPRSPSSVPSS